jgi:hypothetical protein
MSFLRMNAYVNLILFDIELADGSFAKVCRRVREYPVGHRIAAPDTVERICAAVDLASVWYWKQVLCLQRSAATVCLLKKFGLNAELVIGAQHLPFRAHAWVEVAGRVVNDRSPVYELYAVLLRC